MIIATLALLGKAFIVTIGVILAIFFFRGAYRWIMGE